MTVSTMKTKPNPMVYSAGMVFAGSLIVFIGSFGLVAQILSPLTLIGSISYITGGSLLVISNSPSIKLRLYNSLPNIVKNLMFEKSLLELFQDKSRYVQLLAFLIACLSLPEEKIQELQLGMPDTFDHCRQKGLLTTQSADHKTSCTSMVYKEMPLHESSCNYKVPVTVKSIPVPIGQYRAERGLDPFTQRVVKQTIIGLKERAVSTLARCCQREVLSVTNALTQTAVNWVPTVALLSSSTACYYWMSTLLRGKSQYERYLLKYFSSLTSFVLEATKLTSIQVLTSYETSTMLGSLGAAVLSAGAVVALSSTSTGSLSVPAGTVDPLLLLTRGPIKPNHSNSNHNTTINNIIFTETKKTTSIHECANPKRAVLDCILVLMSSSDLFRPVRPLLQDLTRASRTRSHHYCNDHNNQNISQIINANQNNINMHQKDLMQAYMFCQLLAHIVAYRLKCRHPQQWSWVKVIYWKQFFQHTPALETHT